MSFPGGDRPSPHSDQLTGGFVRHVVPPDIPQHFRA